LPVQHQNTAQSLASDNPLYLIICVIPAQFSPVPLQVEVLEASSNKGTPSKKKKEAKKDKQFNTSLIMTTYFEIQETAAWCVQKTGKWMLFNIFLEQFFLSENYLQYNNEKSRAAKRSIS